MLSKSIKTHGSASNLQVLDSGENNTSEFRIHAVDKDGAKPISLWHDVSLVHIDPLTNKPTPYLNFVCEIPKFSRKKFEIATDEVGNPIKQDEKKGQLREVCFLSFSLSQGFFFETKEFPNPSLTVGLLVFLL
jgi:inorganic pyrophosphatase